MSQTLLVAVFSAGPWNIGKFAAQRHILCANVAGSVKAVLAQHAPTAPRRFWQKKTMNFRGNKMRKETIWGLRGTPKLDGL